MKLYKFFHFLRKTKIECAIVWFRFSTSVEADPFHLFFYSIKFIILKPPVYQAT